MRPISILCRRKIHAGLTRYHLSNGWCIDRWEWPECRLHRDEPYQIMDSSSPPGTIRGSSRTLRAALELTDQFDPDRW